MIPLWHPQLKKLTSVPSERQVRVLEQSGWTTDIPKKQKEEAEQIAGPADESQEA